MCCTVSDVTILGLLSLAVSLLLSLLAQAAISVTPSVLSVCSKALATLLTAVSTGEEERGQVDLSQLVLATGIPINKPTQSTALTAEVRGNMDGGWCL